MHLLATSGHVRQAYRGLTKREDVCLLTDAASNKDFRSRPAFHAHTLSAALQVQSASAQPAAQVELTM